MNDKPASFLLVEDDDRHAKLMTRNLEEHRVALRLSRVVDGAEAIAYLEGEDPYADRELPDVILLDLKLPRVDGHEVLRFVKSDPTLRAIPVVILTTSLDDTDRRRAYDNHVNSYLTKPVDYEQFQKLVYDLGYYWGVWNIRHSE